MISQASRDGVKLSLFVLDFLLMQLAGSHIIKKSNSPVVKLAVSRVQRVWVRNPYIFASCLLPACFAFCTAERSCLACHAKRLSERQKAIRGVARQPGTYPAVRFARCSTYYVAPDGWRVVSGAGNVYATGRRRRIRTVVVVLAVLLVSACICLYCGHSGPNEPHVTRLRSRIGIPRSFRCTATDPHPTQHPGRAAGVGASAPRRSVRMRMEAALWRTVRM
jgi:hypothetical protein